MEAVQLSPFFLMIPVLLPVAGGGLLFLHRFREDRNRELYTEAVVCLTSVLVWTALFLVRPGKAEIYSFTGGFSVDFALDRMAALFAGMVSVMWPPVLLYAFEYMKEEKRKNAFFAFYVMTYGITLGVAFAGNMTTLYVFYEMLSLVTLPLVVHYGDHESMFAGRVYAAFTIGGAAAAFFPVVLTTFLTGGGDFTFGGCLGPEAFSGGLPGIRPEGMRQMLQTEFADTTEYDVSLFFVATHGYSNGDGDLELSFFGGLNQQDIEAHMKGKRSLSFDTLASWLKQYVKGDIIVIIQSCGAGSAIYSSTGVQNGAMAKESLDDAEDEFLSRAIEAFARADAEEAPRSGDSANGTGAMRQSRFYVLAASRHHELSWGSESKGYNYFTKWLTEGVGTSGNMPADTNNDGVVTLTELFNYIKQYNTYGIKSSDDGKIYYQHVQRYPVGSQYPLFR